MSDMPDIVLEARGVSKRYGANMALNNVTFCVHRGLVNVLIGENGAGKSTLMRLLAGAERATAGVILMDGRVLELRSPREATVQGIAIVHQELAVMENLDIAENIFAGRELVRSGFVDRGAEEERSDRALRELNKPMEVRGSAGELSLGNRQVVELARSLAHGAKVLILDEPTSALSTTEAESLFRVIADLKSRGVSIVYISHRLHELLHLGDHFTVMRDGRVVGEGERGSVDRQWIVERMSGKVVDSGRCARRSVSTERMLEVRELTVRTAGRPAVEGVSFSVCKGEVLGVYGLLGSGRTELLEAMAGLRPPDSGEVSLCGERVDLSSVDRAIAAGVTLAPEDRQRDGLVPDMSIRENISLASLAEFSRGGWVRRGDEAARVREIAAQLQIAADLELPVTTLSGGNQQKVVLARCLMRRPRVILMDEPTRGVDVRAKAEIHKTLRELAAKGLSIVFTSSEIEETQQLADRVLVMAQGRIAAEFEASAASDEALFAAASPGVEARQ
jgi:erythritol transport system ATP-binding protein